MCKKYFAFKGAQQQLQCINRLLCFQKGPQQQLQCVNTLVAKGPKVTVMHEHFSFKGPLTSLISGASNFNLKIEAFSAG